MLFPTVAFAVFFAIVLTVGWSLARRPVAWRLFMLAASWFFYGCWDYRLWYHEEPPQDVACSI